MRIFLAALTASVLSIGPACANINMATGDYRYLEVASPVKHHHHAYHKKHHGKRREVAHQNKPKVTAPQPKPIEVASLTPELPEPIKTPAKAALNLLDKARRYLHTNPTGWAHNWCGRFMAVIAPELAKKLDNPNWARDWAAAGRRTRMPKLGDIVVLSRGRGGHVGVLAGFDKHGNPRVISGNHGHTVGEGVYPKWRVIAYVEPVGQ